MSEMQDDPRFNKLPKWAQQEIQTVEMRLRETAARLAKIEDNEPSRLWHSRMSRDSKVYIPEEDQIHVSLTENPQDEIFMRLDTDRINRHRFLYLSSMNHALIVEPAGGVNCIKVYPKDALTNSV